MEQLPVLKKLSELDNFQDFRGYRPPVYALFFCDNKSISYIHES